MVYNFKPNVFVKLKHLLLIINPKMEGKKFRTNVLLNKQVCKKLNFSTTFNTMIDAQYSWYNIW
jgi:hypothetical protein